MLGDTMSQALVLVQHYFWQGRGSDDRTSIPSTFEFQSSPAGRGVVRTTVHPFQVHLSSRAVQLPLLGLNEDVFNPLGSVSGGSSASSKNFCRVCSLTLRVLLPF